MQWTYGVTTCAQRIDNLLPKTLDSLAQAGFDKPRLFVDGIPGPIPLCYSGYEITFRNPKIGAYGNWILALAELYIRDPLADRFAVFQDDLIACKGLKEYLSKCPYPPKGYWNLYTFPSNQKLAPPVDGWYESNQFGRGAVGLVFNREAVTIILGDQTTIAKPQDQNLVNGVPRGTKSIDGAVVTAMHNHGFKEFVHNPSLLQHTGELSAIPNPPQPLAVSFPGESHDALEFLPCATTDSETESDKPSQSQGSLQSVSNGGSACRADAKSGV